MSRKLIALFVASTLALGSVSTSGWSAPAGSQQNQPSGAQTAPSGTKNPAPLAPAGAAGIRQAQGAGNELWIIGGFIGVYALLSLLGALDDDDDTPSTGTN